MRWLKLNFSQVFVAWIHLKALRIFVESALRLVLIHVILFPVILMYSRLIMVPLARYGLPVSYQALLLQTDSKRSKKLGEELSSLFMHLDPTAKDCKTDVRGQNHFFCFECHVQLCHT